MSALSAKRYVDSVKGLASQERSTLKSLLDQGIIVAGAVIDGTPEELKDVIKRISLLSKSYYKNSYVLFIICYIYSVLLILSQFENPLLYVLWTRRNLRS